MSRQTHGLHLLAETLRSRRPLVLSLCLLPLSVAVMFPLLYNYASSDVFAYISAEEYNAIQWIGSNTPTKSYVLTDPSSGFLVRGLALRNASTYFVLPDGRMPAESSFFFPDLESNLHSFFTSQSLQDSLQYLLGVPFEQVYIVVTSRTVSWSISPVGTFVFRPVPEANLALITWKLGPPYFIQLYSLNSVRIYQANSSLTLAQ